MTRIIGIRAVDRKRFAVERSRICRIARLRDRESGTNFEVAGVGEFAANLSNLRRDLAFLRIVHIRVFVRLHRTREIKRAAVVHNGGRHLGSVHADGKRAGLKLRRRTQIVERTAVDADAKVRCHAAAVRERAAVDRSKPRNRGSRASCIFIDASNIERIR